MAKVKITGHASGTGVVTVTAPNTSTDRTITLPDTTGTLLDENSSVPAANLTGALPAISGASLTSVNAVNGGRKNMIINGAMNVAQRGTSSTGFTNGGGGYKTVDRYYMGEGGAPSGVFTITQDTDAPVGFVSSTKWDCTTAASMAAGDFLYVEQKIEAQDLQHLNYGTASALQTTLSFWVKSNKTGTYVVWFYQDDDGRHVQSQYTVNIADTWEKKTCVVPADTTGVIDNNTGAGSRVRFVLGTGTTNSSGTAPTAWAADSNANRFAGQTVNISDSTSNYFNITGVQLELGSVATDFEHRSYGEELALCQRYYEQSYAQGAAVGSANRAGSVGSGGTQGQTSTGEIHGGTIQFSVEKRVQPTITFYDHAGTSGKGERLNAGIAWFSGSTMAVTLGNAKNIVFVSTTGNAATGAFAHYTADAEL